MSSERTSRRRCCFAVTMVIGWLASPAQSLAQVNVEPLRSKLRDDRVGGSIDVRLVGRAGNTEGLTAGGSTLVGGRSEPHFAFISASGDYSKLASEVQVDRYGAHGRYNYTLLPRFWWEAFAQIEHDRFRLLTFRWLVGTGPRFGIVDEERVRLFFGTAYMFETERLDLPPASGEPDETRLHRSSNYLAMVFRPDPEMVLASTIFLQPRFDRPADYRVLSVTSVEFAIRKILATTISLTIRYDNEPPLDVERVDFELVNSFGVRF